METFAIHEPHAAVIEQLMALYTDLYNHQGYGAMSIEMRFLKRGQKEILIRCGKEYRFAIDYNEENDVVVEKITQNAS